MLFRSNQDVIIKSSEIYSTNLNFNIEINQTGKISGNAKNDFISKDISSYSSGFSSGFAEGLTAIIISNLILEKDY